MAKRSKTRKNARTTQAAILHCNKIALADLAPIDTLLSNNDIESTGDEYLVDVTEFQTESDLGTPDSPVTKQQKLTGFKPAGDLPFNSDLTATFNNSDGIEPKQSFVVDSANSYFKLSDDSGNGKLRFLARDDVYSDDSGGAIDSAIFEVSEGRPTVNVITPSITSPDITENILLTYEDITNSQLKSVLGLPDTVITEVYNHETDSSMTQIVNPTIDMFMTIIEGERKAKYAPNETVNSFYFKAGERTSNIVSVNEFNAAYFNIHGMLAVKAGDAFVDDISTVTMYIEVSTESTVAAAIAADDESWIIAESKIVPVAEYGVFLSMSTFLCKNAIVRLRINLDATMGSLNIFQMREAGSFTNQFSNTFTGFSLTRLSSPDYFTISTIAATDDDLRITIDDIEVYNPKRTGSITRSATITKQAAVDSGVNWTSSSVVKIYTFDGWGNAYRTSKWTAKIYRAGYDTVTKTGGNTTGSLVTKPENLTTLSGAALNAYYAADPTFEDYYYNGQFTLDYQNS